MCIWESNSSTVLLSKTKHHLFLLNTAEGSGFGSKTINSEISKECFVLGGNSIGWTQTLTQNTTGPFLTHQVSWIYKRFPNKQNLWRRLPWWLSGDESACRCRRHGFFDPWSRKIPHATGQLSPRATQPSGHDWTHHPRARALQQETPPLWEACTTIRE